MVVKVYLSGICGNKEVKKRQQRVLLILDSKNIKYETIDIAEPGSEEQKDFVHNNSTSNGATISDPTPRHPLPPQIFNDDVYCGDYDQFDMANEVDEMEKFLKLVTDDSNVPIAENKLDNGDINETNKVENEPVELNEGGAGGDQKSELKNGNEHQDEEDVEEEAEVATAAATTEADEP